MIPERVLLKDFLCYDQGPDGGPVEFDFTDGPLWSISGDNGAGKSAIFDAITWALFGRHRGGSQEDGRLIRKGAASAEVEFVFCQDGRRFRVRRTVGVRRGRARVEPKTWQAAEYDPAVEDWRPVAGTDTSAGLEAWVRQQLGFGYETFVASVLLLQGESDTLARAAPRQRFEILSGLLDLEPYKRLGQAATERARAAAAQARQAETELNATARVDEQQLAQAQEALAAGEQALAVANEQVTEATLALQDARRYADLLAEHRRLERELAATQQLLEDAAQIRRDFEEWGRVNDALPRLEQALTDLHEAADLEAHSAKAAQKAAEIDVGGLAQAAERAAQAAELADEQRRMHAAQWGTLSAAEPPLRQLLATRQTLDRRERALAEQGEPMHWQARLEEAQRRLGQAQEAEAREQQRHAEALLERAQATADLNRAREQLRLRREAGREAVCSRCGQRIDAAHMRRELEDAQRAEELAQGALVEAEERLQAAQHSLKRAQDEVRAAKDHCDKARAGLDLARREEREAQQARAEWEEASRLAATQAPPDLLSAVAEAPLPIAEETVRDLGRRLADLRRAVDQAERQARQARQEADRARQAQQRAVLERQRLESEARQATDSSRALRRQAEVRLADVDATWRQRALGGDASLLPELRARRTALAGVEERHARLQRAQADRDLLEVEIQSAQRNVEAIAPARRQPVAEAQRLLDDARAAQRQRSTERDRAQREVQVLETQRQRRQELEGAAKHHARQRALWQRLEDLLGRGGLQAYLMDESLRSIEQLADETLARISGGRLQLRLSREPGRGGEDEIRIQAVDLASGDEPLEVAFISGGQKFRASVALAAGIGQYAGRGSGSVRSLIIDEGFGSLDSQGRQQMIDELHALARLLDRLIVVSHQEDFQDRTLFPTGYLLRKVGSHTEVERVV